MSYDMESTVEDLRICLLKLIRYQKGSLQTLILEKPNEWQGWDLLGRLLRYCANKCMQQILVLLLVNTDVMFVSDCQRQVD